MWRNLKGNKGNSVPRQLIFFDCETLPAASENGKFAAHGLRLGIAHRGSWRKGKWTRASECVFRDPGEFWDFVFGFARKGDTTWLVAHSLVFDLAAVKLWELWDSGQLEIDQRRVRINPGESPPRYRVNQATAVLSDPPTILPFRVVETGARLLCIDTLNYFRCKLADLGEAAGLTKLPMPEFSASDRDWETYCRRDVEILRESFLGLLRFARGYKLGNFAKTAPSQAMNAFRHRFMRHKIVLHDREDVRALERASYFGGETRLFYWGELTQTIHQCDVTSLFPSVMRDNNFPVKLRRWEMRDGPLALAPSIRPEDSIAKVWLSGAAEVFPAKIDGATRYVSGEIVTTLAGPELAYAVKLGYVKLWGSWAEYETAPVFTEFIDHFWRLRQRFKREGNRLYDQFAKLLMNSLYGKFGQKSAAWVDQPGRIAETPWSQWVEMSTASGERSEWRAIGERVQRLDVPGEISGTFPAIASFVTSYARQRMRQLRSLLGPCDLFYQGVDSLIVSQDGFLKLLAAGEVADFELGKLRYQLSASSGGIWAQHNYSLGEKQVIAGIKPTAINLGDGRYQQERFGRNGSLFRGATAPGVNSWQETKTVSHSQRPAPGFIAPRHVPAWNELR